MSASLADIDRRARDVFDAIMDTNINLGFLQALTPANFDWCSAREPNMGITPLQALVFNVTDWTLDDEGVDEAMKKAKWMMSQGADPLQHKQDVDIPEDRDEEDAEDMFEVTEAIKIGDADFDPVCVNWEDENGTGLSAMGAALRLFSDLTDLSKACVYEEMEVPESVSRPLKFVTELTTLFKSSVPSKGSHVVVNEQVVERWAALAQDQASHDVTFETADGTCSAHALILKIASPVLRASLSSTMTEGTEKRIIIKDSPIVGVKLLLELIYVGGCSIDVDVKAALEALGLAHRWQIHDVLDMIQKMLQDMLTEETFDAIASASERLQLDILTQACKAFGNQSVIIQKRAKSRKLPAALQAWFFDATSSSRKAKKRRML